MISGEKLEKLKSALTEDKERIAAKLEAMGDVEFGDTPGEDNEDADEVEETLNRGSAARLLKKRLEDIEAAIGKIEAGTYGKCEKCGSEISGDVIDADPESALCKNCKG